MLSKGTVTKKGKLKRRSTMDAEEEKAKEERKRRQKEEDDAKREMHDKKEQSKTTTAKDLSRMDVDEFLNEDFLNAQHGDDDDEEGDEGDSSEEDDDDSEAEAVADVPSSRLAPPSGVGSDSDSDSDSDAASASSARFKLQMAELAAKDPEFIKHLEENDPGLLEFGEGDDDDEDDDAEEEEEGAGGDDSYDDDDDDDDDDDGAPAPAPSPSAAPSAPSSGSQINLSPSLLSATASSAYGESSLKSLKKIMSMLSSASKMGDATDDRTPYYVPSSEVFEEVREREKRERERESPKPRLLTTNPKTQTLNSTAAQGGAVQDAQGSLQAPEPHSAGEPRRPHPRLQVLFCSFLA